MTTRDVANETQAIDSMVIWGQICCLGAQAVAVPLADRPLVALNIVKVEESIARTIRLQLKLTPRKHILAMRTRVLIFYSTSVIVRSPPKACAYQVLRIRLLCVSLMLFQYLFFLECRTQRVQPSRRSGRLQGASKGRRRCERDLDPGIR